MIKIFCGSPGNICLRITVYVACFRSPLYLTQVNFMEIPLLTQGTDTNVAIFPI